MTLPTWLRNILASHIRQKVAHKLACLPSLLRNIFKPKCSGWCGKCLYGCVMAATTKEKR